MTLPLQTGSAIIGARVLSADAAAAAGERDATVALANDARRRSWPRAPSAHADVHVNIVRPRGERAGQGIDEATGGKEVVGRRAAVDADWAPQENVDGVHVTDAAKADA